MTWGTDMPTTVLLTGQPGAVFAGLDLRYDHGPQYMARDFQKEIKFLGIQSSPAFVRAPEGNGVAEWFFKVLNENLLRVRSFQTIEGLRAALYEFRETYNRGWILAKHRYKTPFQIRQALAP